MLRNYCQRPGVYLFGVGGFLCGICVDFVTRGDLTFVPSDDTMQAKITTL